VALAQILSPSVPLSLGLGFLTMGLLNVNMAPVPTAVQTLVPPRARALASAVTLAFANLVGFGLGPLVTGAVSDILAVHVGAASLRLSLLFSLIPLAAGAVLFLVGGRWLEREMTPEIVDEPAPPLEAAPSAA
jgi:MFS family permease